MFLFFCQSNTSLLYLLIFEGAKLAKFLLQCKLLAKIIGQTHGFFHSTYYSFQYARLKIKAHFHFVILNRVKDPENTN